jgi:histidyl-tRNA synthetase
MSSPITLPFGGSAINARLTSFDVVNVAVSYLPVQIEIGTDTTEGVETKKITDVFKSRGESPILIDASSIQVARAGLLCRLYSLRSVATAKDNKNYLVKQIASFLNSNITPVFQDEETAGDVLLAALSGFGYCLVPASTTTAYMILISEAMALCDLAPVVLTKEETKAVLDYPFLSIGAACLLSAAASNINNTLDCISALSCEAYGGNGLLESFGSEYFELNRPQRGQMLSAGNLKLLLDGSKRVAAGGKGSGGGKSTAVETAARDAAAVHFKSIPQITGPCSEAISAIAKSVDIELNSVENTSDRNPGAVFDASQVTLNVSSLSTIFSTLTEACKNRSRQVQSLSQLPTPPPPSNGGLNFASVTTSSSSSFAMGSPFSLLTDLSLSLLAELATAVQVLLSLDTPTPSSSSSSAPSTNEQQGAAAGESKEGKEVKVHVSAGKPDVDDPTWTPEQLAKVLEKRKAKADKAAQKAAEKASKKGGNGAGGTSKASTPMLGAGTAQLLSFIQTTCAGEEGGGSVDYAKLATLVNPFAGSTGAGVSASGLFEFCTALLEKLNAGGKRRPKIAKGTRDYTPDQMRIREQVFTSIKRVFKRHGGVEIDTPVFELKEVLTGKYGEDSKLIYDLADQGGEMLSLRYDLTVPFARFLAMNSVGNIKRYHIAKVYRRDQPVLSRGRYREFYQCDFDVAGAYSPMVPDAEVITVATEILSDLPVGTFSIKLNHRKLLDAIFDICGVPADKFRPICSAVDKLDKSPWEEVKMEMVQEKGLPEESADKIGTYVLFSGPPKVLWKQLMEENKFGSHKEAAVAMAELKLLFDYLEAMGSLQHVSFDLSLARGLDYYTGVIYEAVLTDGTSTVGSIAAGGRYDNLVGMFSPSGMQTPCVGVSIGIERVFTIMEKKAEQMKILQSSNIQVFIASIGAGLLLERMKIAKALWTENISCEYSHQEKPTFKKQLDEALERGIPFMIVFGQDELDQNIVKVKDMIAHTEVEVRWGEGLECNKEGGAESLVAALLSRGCVSNNVGGTELIDNMKVQITLLQGRDPDSSSKPSVSVSSLPTPAQSQLVEIAPATAGANGSGKKLPKFRQLEI